MKIGKIITFLGAQASGKSTLVKQVEEALPDTTAFYEGEHFPDYVEEAFQNPDKRIRAFLYFHNLWLDQYHQAEHIRQEGKIALLDTFWFTNYFYLDTLPYPIEQEIIKGLMKTVSSILPPPDLMFHLDMDEEEMISRIKSRGRYWEVEPDWLAEPLGVKKRHEAFLENEKEKNLYFPEVPIHRLDAKDSYQKNEVIKILNLQGKLLQNLFSTMPLNCNSLSNRVIFERI